MNDKNSIRIDEAICDKCGIIGALYHLYYNTGQRIGSTYCLKCAKERRDELTE